MQTGTIFKDHYSYHEKLLLAQRDLQKTTGHSLHKGTPREVFIHSFLAAHLGSTASLGTGEIIDARSKSGGARNQMDIVVSDARVPILNVGGDIAMHLVEGVRATIEVKSTLTEADLEQACDAGQTINSLWGPPAHAGEQNFTPRRFLVAYDGPKNMATVFKWLKGYYQSSESGSAAKYRKLREAWSPQDEQPLREMGRSSTLDGIFVLGKGFILFEGFSFSVDPSSQLRPSSGAPKRSVPFHWSVCNCDTGALHIFFLALFDAISVNANKRLLASYAGNLQFRSMTSEVMNFVTRI